MLKLKLRSIIQDNLSIVLQYDPFNRFSGVTTKTHFLNLIKNDPAFAPFFLHNEKYATARIGGNLITSLHRKLGDMYENIFKTLLQEKLNVPEVDLSYSVKLNIDGKMQERSTDGLIYLNKLTESSHLHLSSLFAIENQRGIAFEVRSCYQIGDSKRIQADRDMSLALKEENIMPVMLIFCATSLTSPVERLSKYWKLYQGKDSFELVKNLTGFDLYAYLTEEADVIEPLMKKIFDMM